MPLSNLRQRPLLSRSSTMTDRAGAGIWAMLPERSKDDADFERTAGRVAEGLQAA
jgi:hypothetical protein